MNQAVWVGIYYTGEELIHGSLVGKHHEVNWGQLEGQYHNCTEINNM